MTACYTCSLSTVKVSEHKSVSMCTLQQQHNYITRVHILLHPQHQYMFEHVVADLIEER